MNTLINSTSGRWLHLTELLLATNHENVHWNLFLYLQQHGTITKTERVILALGFQRLRAICSHFSLD